MSNYLDQTGLSYFYQKLKAKFALRSQSLPVIADISRNEETGAMELWSKNLNNIVTTGMYNAITCTNAKFQYSTLIVIGYYLSGYCTQIQQDVTTGRLATRSQINGVWSNWIEIDTSAFYTKAETDAALLAKVNTEAGKGLSSNDYTTAEKTKLGATNVGYGTCATAAATAEKAVTISGNDNWSLTNGAIIAVLCSYTNTASNPKLNVNGTGAYPVRYNTGNITTSNLSYVTTAKRTHLFMFNGSAWVFLGWSVDNNTTYSNMSQTEATTGTATAARCISAAVLNKTIDDKIDDFYTKSEVDDALAEKVDAETGKGLSSNDYTDEEKTKLSAVGSILTNAETDYSVTIPNSTSWTSTNYEIELTLGTWILVCSAAFASNNVGRRGVVWYSDTLLNHGANTANAVDGGITRLSSVAIANIYTPTAMVEPRVFQTSGGDLSVGIRVRAIKIG